MAGQAKAHVVADGLGQIAYLTNVAVALFAGHTGPDVGLVREIDKVGLVERLDPPQGLALFPVRDQRIDLGLLVGCHLNVLVAAHAFGRGWDAGHRAIQHARMAEYTLCAGRYVGLVVKGEGFCFGCAGKSPIVERESDRQQDHQTRGGHKKQELSSVKSGLSIFHLDPSSITVNTSPGVTIQAIILG